MYLRRSALSTYSQSPLVLSLFDVVFKISLQRIISVKSVVSKIGAIQSLFAVATRLDHHAVSVAAINTKPLLDIPLFLIGMYAYCHSTVVETHSIPAFIVLLVLGSVGIPSIPAEIKSSAISSNVHHSQAVGQSGKLP